MTVGHRLLGRTGRTVSELGLGCGGLWARRWIGDQTAIDLVHRAIELGITVFDSGASYGDGLAEARLGRALRSHRHRLDRLLVSTKLGTVRDGRWRLAKDFGPDSIEAQLLGSLERLGVDHIPLVHLHGPDPVHLTDDLLGTLVRLRTEGFIGLLGVNGFEHQIEAALDTGVFDVVMPFYNPIHRSSEPVIARAADMGLGVMAAGPLARMAFLDQAAGAWHHPTGWWYALRRLRDRMLAGDAVERARRYGYLARVKGWTAAQACLGFVLANPEVHCAVFGTVDPDHLADNAAVSGRALPEVVLARIHDTP